MTRDYKDPKNMQGEIREDYEKLKKSKEDTYKIIEIQKKVKDKIKVEHKSIVD
jgi:hypothetical protein